MVFSVCVRASFHLLVRGCSAILPSSPPPSSSPPLLLLPFSPPPPLLSLQPCVHIEGAINDAVDALTSRGVLGSRGVRALAELWVVLWPPLLHP